MSTLSHVLVIKDVNKSFIRLASHPGDITESIIGPPSMYNSCQFFCLVTKACTVMLDIGGLCKIVDNDTRKTSIV